MAIGMARMMGFHFLENFDRRTSRGASPNSGAAGTSRCRASCAIYLYIPLGGNRLSPLRTYFNLWIVFLASGLWHGASWTFVLWGAYHGFFLALDKLVWLDVSKRLGGSSIPC
jgi:alginate O-acetyltransferase complex protein AlgI